MLPAATSNSYSANGITITHNNGRFTMNGTASTSKSFEIVTKGENYGELEAGVKYTLSLNNLSGAASSNPPSIIIRTKNADGTETAYQTQAGSPAFEFTPSENCTLIRFAIGVSTGYGYTDYVIEPMLMAAGDTGGADESKIITTITASKDFSVQGAVDVIGVLYGHDHLNVESATNGIQFIEFICDNNELDDLYVVSVSGLAAGSYFLTTNKGVKMGFTLDAALPNAAVVGYNEYFAKGNNPTYVALRFQDANGNTINTKPTKATVAEYADGMTEITGFVQERTPGTVKTESCFVVSIDKDTRTIKIVPYGTGFQREINY
jgi:hypothetical protein